MTWSDLTENKLLLAVFTAACGFFFALIAERIKSRKASRKQLSWDVRVDDRLLQVGEGSSAERITVSYGDVEVKNLTQVLASFENTGNSVIKNQYLRFRFPDESKILEVALDPEPEPELGVAEVGNEKASDLDRRYLIAHLEVGQSVRYRIVSDGGKWRSWAGVHPFNEEGGVEFQRRDVVRAREDEEEVVPFLRSSAMLITFLSLTVVAPPILNFLTAGMVLLVGAHVSSKAPAVVRVLGRFLAQKPEYNVVVNDAHAVQVGSDNQLRSLYEAAETR
ncbi:MULTISPECIES: RIP homotypic interaction motif-containing protein [Micromonospora]|uniref:RIP homotypic interaction motif-containing protein n=1 Tax=Micromonospora TaxID=1873 RepID=UPI0001C46F43|nr:RIP homotypic interaction motif-containing protein [Micromonospora sp. L5]ADU09161.1 hypothetical protein ML5_3649 [Micromonospora sp. L5]